MIKIGFTKKTHGLNGNLKVQVEERYLEDFANADHIFIEINGSKVPYFIEDLRGGNELIIKLEDIDDINAAKLITSKELFLKEEQIIPAEKRTHKVKGEEDFDTEGFVLKSPENEVIGEVKEILHMPGQFMASVTTKSGDKFIPLNEHFVVKLNRPSREIIVDLPEGLLDL